jgi:hypothetical protein
MSRPPPPSSVSHFSKVGRNLAKSGGRLLVDQAKVSDGGGQSSLQEHQPNASDGSKSSGNWPKMDRASKGAGSEKVEEEGQKMRNSLELELTKYYEKQTEQVYS